MFWPLIWPVSMSWFRKKLNLYTLDFGIEFAPGLGTCSPICQTASKRSVLMTPLIRGVWQTWITGSKSCTNIKHRCSTGAWFQSIFTRPLVLCVCLWAAEPVCLGKDWVQHTEHIGIWLLTPSIFCTLGGGGPEMVEGGWGLLKLPHAPRIRKSLGN